MLRYVDMKKIFAVVTLLFFYVFPIKQSFAVQEFTTTLNATYSVGISGSTTVKNEIHIKNNFSSIYAKQYAFEVSSNQLSGVTANSQDGKPLEINTTQTDAKTSIALVFPDKIIGKDQERVFTIQYDQPDISILAGKVLEIDIPKLVQVDEFAEYNITVTVPSKFGDPAIVNPPSYRLQHDGGFTTLNFSKNTKDGINVIFGEKQVFSFLVKYHLNNPSISQGISQVALPPDTAFQKIFYSSITPKPEKIEKDEDGNWIATFNIGSQKEIEIDAQGIVIVYLHPTVQMPALPQKLDKGYVSEQKFWEISDPGIQSLAQQYRTPKDIYNFLVKGFTYNYDRLNQQTQNRLGAASAVKNPTQVLCQEFTDSFIAIARAQGIPAREINGFAFTENNRLRPLSLIADVLHAWPEYYDAKQKVWIPVDPTWGNTTGGVDFFTKLDFNHIVFAIHGKSSEKPFPAGVYKIAGKEEKDVTIQITGDAPQEISDVSLSIKRDTSTKLGFTTESTLIVTNNTGIAWYDIPVHFETTDGIAVTKDTPRSIQALLPFQTVEIPVTVQSTNTLVEQKGKVSVEVEGKTTAYEVTTKRNLLPIYMGVGALGVAVLAGSVLVLKTRR